MNLVDNESEEYDDTDDFDDDDYQDFIDREFGENRNNSIPKIWRWTAIGLLLLIAATIMLAFGR